MKKFIITTACTLVLSLFGTLGANQDALNIKDLLSKESSTETVEQQVADNTVDTTIEEPKEITEEATTLPAENEVNTQASNAIDNHIEETTDVVKEATTKKKDATPSKTAKEMTANAAKATPAAKAKETKTQQTATPKVNNTRTTKEYVQPANNDVVKDTVINSNNVQKIVYDSKNNCYTLNGKVIAYGNVDLSDIGSVEDILAKFNNCGFKVETPTNKNTSTNATNKNTNNSSKTNANNGSQKTTTTNTQKQTTNPTTPSTNSNNTQNNSGLSNYANQVLQLVNQERAKAGLSALTTNSALTAAANKRAQETKQSFSHTRPNGTSFSTVLKEYGISYRTSGENIAYGQRTPQEVVNGWMNSPGHRANILNPNFNKIGIGVYESNGTIYWSQLFTD